jgi:hypothetical protein
MAETRELVHQTHGGAHPPMDFEPKHAK